MNFHNRKNETTKSNQLKLSNFLQRKEKEKGSKKSFCNFWLKAIFRAFV